MRNSIQHFIDFRITNLQESARKFSQSPQDIAGFVNAVKEEALQFALDFIGETFTGCNDVLRESPVRRASWEVVRTDEKHLITSIGSVRYEKTLFKNKKSGERKYLVDEAMGIDPHERISEDAIAQMLEESVQTCYRKGGEAVSMLDKISKETVKDKLHALEFPTEDEADPVTEKKVVDYLYIEADEDHASLQFNEKKGDLEKSESGRKLNGIITKLVYVHEGIAKDAPKSGRHHLVNPHYFSGLYEGKEGNDKLWDEVWNYLDRTYDLSKVKKVYLSADGGAWIMAGRKRLNGLVYALDEFHLQKLPDQNDETHAGQRGGRQKGTLQIDRRGHEGRVPVLCGHAGNARKDGFREGKDCRRDKVCAGQLECCKSEAEKPQEPLRVQCRRACKPRAFQSHEHGCNGLEQNGCRQDGASSCVVLERREHA